MKEKKQFLMYYAIIVFFCFTGCKKDEPNETVTDIDGNIYHTVMVGNSVWMVENLKVTRYNDGTEILNVAENSDWYNTTSGAYCNYNNDTGLVNNYGRLYNWYAVDSDKLCPAGWHIPTYSEWPTYNSILESTDGFPAVFAGMRYSTGWFNYLDHAGYWWIVDYDEPEEAFRATILIGNDAINESKTNKRYGFSVRCVKD